MATRFKTARLDKIKQIIKEKKQIDVSQLSSILSVSEVTVRSYLEMLEQEGFVIRTHGGAVLNEAKPPVLPFSAAAQLNEDMTDQELIADIALHHIKEGDVIFLSAGNICAMIASKLPEDKNLTVITNSLPVINILTEKPAISSILAGGTVDVQNKSLKGDMVTGCLENLFIDKAFLESGGVDLKRGYSLNNMGDLPIYQFVMNISDETIIVVPKSRFDKTALVRFAPITAAKKVITNEDIPGTYKAFFFESCIQIFTSYDL